VRAIPAPILRVGVRVVGQSANTLVTPDGGEVPSFRVDDVVDFLHWCQRPHVHTSPPNVLHEAPGVDQVGSEGFALAHLVIGQLDTGNHDDSSISRVPVVI
jgi:hypothetical protein